jgi:hypothetical protein
MAGITTTTNLIALFARSAGTIYETKPTKQLVITDSFANTGGVSVGDANVGTYVVQDLIPDTQYSLTFKLERNVAGVWTELANSITPAAVEGLPDSTTSEGLSTDGTGGSLPGYWWSSNDMTNRLLYFKTIDNDGTSISASGFGQTRNTVSPYQPNSDFKLHTFVSNANRFVLNEKGKPLIGGFQQEFGGINSQLEPNLHTYDAYLFFFEKPSTAPSDLNAHLTNRFMISPDYLGYNSSNNTKGFWRIPEVNLLASGPDEYPIGLNLVDGLFDPTSSDDKFGGPMDRDKEYYAAFMFVNTTSQYVVSVNSNTIKWYTFTIPLGGVWSISLKNFRVVHDVDVNLSRSTTVAVEIDGIGTQGTVNPSDQFRITMTATPN